MGAPQVDQVNVVIGDVDGAARFLTGLGVGVPEGPPGWQTHHRSVPSATSSHASHDPAEPAFGLELDSAVFAGEWGGLAPTFAGVVLNLRVDGRDEVDRLHDVAASLGGRSCRAPYDAFWGSRYAVVEGPGPVLVGLMSVPDPDRRRPPPDPTTWT